MIFSLHSKKGPPIKSMQYGMAGNTASKHCRIAFGLPGKLIITVWFLMPAVCLDRMAVGTNCRLVLRINSPKPGIIFVHTASVASGVTSRSDGPVPPQVIIKQQFSTSAILISVCSISAFSSGITAYTFSHSLFRYSVMVATINCPGISSYIPKLARSETLIIPIFISMIRG